MAKLFDYKRKDTFIHNLSGLSKLICLIFLTFTVMLSFDIRVIWFVMIFSVVVIKASNVDFSRLKVAFAYIGFFFTMNIILTFLLSPEYGVSLYDSRTVLFVFSDRYVLTLEQIFYQITKLSKYISVIPVGFAFLLTTDPSELSASLNKIGIPYKVSYVVALTLRYFPDVQDEYKIVSKAQQARGLNVSKDTPISKRFKNALLMFMPLIFSTLDRIENISNAMDLRGFGKMKKRTWYREEPLTRNDYYSITVTGLIFITSIAISIFINGSRFYNPF